MFIHLETQNLVGECSVFRDALGDKTDSVLINLFRLDQLEQVQGGNDKI